MSRVISKAELSRWAGVTRTAVTKACKNSLADAVVDGKVNAELPIVRDWLATHDVYQLPPEPEPTDDAKTKSKKQPAKKPRAKTKSKPPPKSSPLVQTRVGNYDLEQLEDLTVRQVVMRYGSIDGFKRFVESLKHIADFKYREQRVKLQRGELVERSKISKVVFPLIDVAFSRLVTDVPDTVTKLVIARVESGGPDTMMDVQKIIRDANSRVLQNVKTSAAKLEFLKDAS